MAQQNHIMYGTPGPSAVSVLGYWLLKTVPVSPCGIESSGSGATPEHKGHGPAWK
eukprot:CAMPEP_0181225694 /NCGR_PEP_ID=MMETSP1096-20121128/31842_1 /TAXON_ID=156174 ORGANISM="Chrysochromulina ericina, Strain CCMP281" /NCGR_SAMPLE_ID=MMETSP1096 /ASSEMBLY_ACC=CAM_ASM_000453 /LENGTH=54 /DNA_ID=CAMNT_0023318951 /DNA_START=140 /DNA_END=304 /DNA_ORIENTATION=+